MKVDVIENGEKIGRDGTQLEKELMLKVIEMQQLLAESRGVIVELCSYLPDDEPSNAAKGNGLDILDKLLKYKHFKQPNNQ